MHQMRLSLHTTAWIFAATAVVIGACASTSQQLGEYWQPAATLVVVNERDNTAAVFISHAGAKVRRLDDIGPYSTRTFNLRRADFTSDELQLFAYYLADGMTVVSGAEQFYPGATYTWTLGPMRGFQFLVPRRSTHE